MGSLPPIVHDLPVMRAVYGELKDDTPTTAARVPADTAQTKGFVARTVP